MKILLLFTLLAGFYACRVQNAETSGMVDSPDGKIYVEVKLGDHGSARYHVTHKGETVIELSTLGVVRKDADFTNRLTLLNVTSIEEVRDSFVMHHGKQKQIPYQANKRVFSFADSVGNKMDVIFQVSNDGVAFRYYFPGSTTEKKSILSEETSFKIPAESRAWMQPCADAKTSWGRCNPSYEEYYRMDIPVGTESPFEAGWVFPALFHTGQSWVLLSETGLEPTYCATRLRADSPGGEYKIGFPQQPEVSHGGELFPESVLPWGSPWRIIAIGSLKTIVESNLGVSLANPAIPGDFSWVEPGRSSWSWVLLKDDNTTFPVQKQFIDYASEMGWEYCLIDALWDVQIGYDKIKELADYAESRNVGLLLWYNSSGDWNDTPQTPKDMMLTHESRMKEFERIKALGVKGVKIDFFGGDGQSVIQYYHEILTDAADAGLVVNFHGCTLPRGWQRTYPNLVSMESVKGMEYVTFEQENADQVVPHCAMLPFTRNVFDPMDFTPVCFSEVPNIQRHSSNGFELALSVLFCSGVQHYAETPEGMDHVPVFVKNAMKNVPVSWDESVFVDGFPGEYVVIARRIGEKWFVAGINSTETKMPLTLDLSFVNGLKGTLISDDEDSRSFLQKDFQVPENGMVDFVVQGNGGFLIQLSN